MMPEHMPACFMDWECECGVSATSIPLIGMRKDWIYLAAIESHRGYQPCERVNGKTFAHVECTRKAGRWFAKISKAQTTDPNPERQTIMSDDAEQEREQTINGIVSIERIADALEKLAACVEINPKTGRARFRVQRVRIRMTRKRSEQEPAPDPNFRW